MRASVHEYDGGNIASRGYLGLPDGTLNRPGILVVHEAPGLDDHAKRRAEMLAELGYVALAADLYGGGRVAGGPDEALELAGALRGDPHLLRERVGRALRVLSSLPTVDHNRLGAIGYCFGGTCVLELARMGAAVSGVVSFHGVLDTQLPATPGVIKARILVCTGSADPRVPPEQIRRFETEMSAAGADWQLTTYGHAKHGFTNPASDAVQLPGFAYSRSADRRSWAAMQAFFGEVCA